MGEGAIDRGNDMMSDRGNHTETGQRRILSLVKAFSGLEIKLDSEKYAIERDSLIEAPGTLLFVGVLLVLSLLFLSSVVAFPYYSPVTNVEEVALYYTSAGNFVKYGFLNSGFLLDFSTSSSALDHPYIYSHMPPGPDIFIALLLKLMPEGYRFVRLVFWAVFLAGMFCYFHFAKLVLRKFGVAGAGYAVLFISFYSIIHTFDDPVYAPFPLLAFLPLLALQAYYRTARWWYLAITLGVGLFSAVYLDYFTLVLVAWCWGLLYFTQLLPLKRRHLVAFAGAIFGGVALHLLQNFLYFGGDLFFQELGMTLSNRITGFPTQDDMKAFYQAHSLVHHGAAKLNMMGLLAQLWDALKFPGRAYLVIAALVAVGWVLARNIRWSKESSLVMMRNAEVLEFEQAVRRFVALWMWVVGTILLPMFVFPAFAQEYGMAGTGLHWYFLGIGAAATTLYGIRMVFAQRLQIEITQIWGPKFWRYLGHICGLLAISALLATSIWRAVSYQADQFRSSLAVFKEAKYNKLSDIREFGREVFMTNINPVTVGFFVGEAGFGVCELSALPEAGDIDASQCRVSYVRQRERYETVRPRYFFFFRELFPGFLRCLPSAYYPLTNQGGDKCFETMQQRLAERFYRVADTGLYEVYDLTRKVEIP